MFVLRVFGGADGRDGGWRFRSKAEEVASGVGFFDEGMEGLKVDRGDVYGCWGCWVGSRRYRSGRLGGKVQGGLCIPHGDQDGFGMTRMSEQDGVFGVVDVGIVAAVPGYSEDDVDRRGSGEV